MAAPGGNALFYAVLVAPGFIAVMTTISLGVIEDDYPPFVLLVSSLVASLFIDAFFLGGYQLFFGDITSFDQLTGLLFDPFFRVDYILAIFLSSFLLGVAGAFGILVDLPGRMRRVMQARSRVRYNPRQPWENFMNETGSIRIKTTDDQLYAGNVIEWSRAGRSKEVRIANPHRYDEDQHLYEPVGREDMLFLEEDIDRLLMRSRDGELPLEDETHDEETSERANGESSE